MFITAHKHIKGKVLILLQTHSQLLVLNLHVLPKGTFSKSDMNTSLRINQLYT